MPDDRTVDRIVEALAGAWRSGVPCKIDHLHAELTEHDAYLVQDGVAEALEWFAGRRVTAWKAGGRDHLTAAPLPRVLPSGEEWSPAVNAPVIVEGEIALRLAQTPSSPHEVPDCIGSMCAAIEVVSTRMAGGLAAPAAWKLADQQLHASCLLGAEIPFVARDWASQRGTITINDTTTRHFEGSHPNGDPVFPLRWLVEHAARRAQPLRSGDVIITGAWTMVEAQPGDQVRVQFDGVGTVVVRIAA